MVELLKQLADYQCKLIVILLSLLFQVFFQHLIQKLHYRVIQSSI